MSVQTEDQERAGGRLFTGFGAYVKAMLVCLVVVAIAVVFLPRRNESHVPVINYSMDLAMVRREAPYQVWVPTGLPARWRATSSDVDKGRGYTWRLGFATPDDHHALLAQSNQAPADFATRIAGTKVVDGTQQVGADIWERRYQRDKKQRALIRRLPGVTLVVAGTGPWEELGVFAASLKY